MRVPLIVVLLAINFQSFSQNVTAKDDRIPIKAYIGVDNPISFTVEKNSCKSVYLKAKKGQIEESLPCRIIYRCKEIGWDSITVYKKNSNKKIGHFIVLALPFPDPVAMVGGKSSGDFPKGLFMAQGGIGAGPQPFLGFELSFQVVSYMTIVVRDSAVLFIKSYKGNAFNKELVDMFKTLKENDRVIFSSIVVKYPNNELRNAGGLEYRIIEPSINNKTSGQ